MLLPLVLFLFAVQADAAAWTCQQSCVILSGYNCTQGPPGTPGTNATLPTVNYSLTGTLSAAVLTATASASVPTLSVTSMVNLPSYTTTAKNAIASPAVGMFVYDSTMAQPNYYAAGAWTPVTPTASLTLSGTLTAGTVGSTAASFTTMTATTSTLTSVTVVSALKLPSYTNATKNAIATPSAGTLVFDSTYATASVYTGSAWRNMRNEVGEALFNGSYTTTTFVASTTVVELVPTFILSTTSTDFFAIVAGRLRYTGWTQANAIVTVTLSTTMTGGSTNQKYAFGLYRNGVAVTGVSFLQNIYDSNDYQTVTFTKFLAIYPYDSFSVFAKSAGGTLALILNQITVVCHTI